MSSIIFFFSFLYGTFFFMGLFLWIEYYFKCNLKLHLNFNFWIKLILSGVIFFVDYLYFFKNIFKGLFLYIYHLYYDFFIGSILTSRYTETDLNSPMPVYDEFPEDNTDGEDGSAYIKSKDFNLINFEYAYLYLRFIQFWRSFYLIYYIFITYIYYSLKKLIFLIFKSNFVFWFLYFLFLKLFQLFKYIVFKLFIKHYWEFFLRIRTYIFIIIHQEYFFVWIYRYFSNTWWFELILRGNKPYNEREPSSQYYKFFLKFYGFFFLHLKDQNIKTKFKSNFILLFIFFILFYLFNFIIWFIKKGFSNIYVLKLEYFIKSKIYIYILKFEYFNFSSIIKYIFYFISFKIYNIFFKTILLFFVKIFIFGWTYFIKYILIFCGYILNYIFIFLNVIVLNLILIFIKTFPLILNLIFYLRGFLVIFMIIYYIDLEFLILVFNYSIDALYTFYHVTPRPHLYYIANNNIKNFPITNEFGVIPYEFWEEYPLLSATPLEYHNKLKKLPQRLLTKDSKLALDINIYLSLRWVEDRYGHFFIVKDYHLKFMAYLKKHFWNFKLWRNQWLHFLNIYRLLWLTYYHIVIPYEYFYIQHKFSYCCKYLFTTLFLNMLFIPFYWYYFFLRKILYINIFILIDYCLNIVLFLVHFFFNLLYKLWFDYLIKFFKIFYEFFLFYIKWVYFTFFKFFYKFESFIGKIINWLKQNNEFCFFFFNSIYIKSLHWYFFIILFNILDIEIYQQVKIFCIKFYNNNNFYSLNFAFAFELINLLNSLYFKYKILNESNNLKHYYFLRELNFTYEIFLYIFYFLWESLDQFIDILSLNYDQFRIYYHNRIDIDEVLFLGELSKKIKIEAGLKKRFISNKFRKSSVYNIGSFDSMYLSTFSFILLDLFSPNYTKIEKFFSRGLIYSEYTWHYNLVFAFEYFLIIWVICCFGWFFFPKTYKFLGEKSVNLNAEYCWRQFRKSKGEDIIWLFTNINKYVKNYFSNTKYNEGTNFRKEFEEDPEFLNYMNELNYARENKTSLNTWSKFEQMAENPYIWRVYWLNEFMTKLRIHELKNVTNPKFKFSMFYFNPEYSSYYNNYMYNYVFFQALLLYGVKRNEYLNIAELNEGIFTLIPQFHNKVFKKRWICSNNLKEYFFSLDERVYYGMLPWWCLHKDLFSYQLLDTKIIFENDKTFEEDEKFFLVEAPSMWLSSFFAYWLYFIPLFVCIKYSLIWPRHYLILRQELFFYFYGFLGRFSVFNDIFNVLPSPYWADVTGERKKAGSQSGTRRKYKRRYRNRLRYLMDVTGWGPFCWAKARLNKKFYFLNGFYILYMYIKYIIIYLFIIILSLIIFYARTGNKIYITSNYKLWRNKFYKDFHKYQLYSNTKNFVKLNFFKKW